MSEFLNFLRLISAGLIIVSMAMSFAHIIRITVLLEPLDSRFTSHLVMFCIQFALVVILLRRVFP